MSRRMARTGIFAGVLAVVIACAVLIMSQAVYADGADVTLKYGKKAVVSTGIYVGMIDMGSKAKGVKKITMTSSNKKVAKPINGIASADFPYPHFQCGKAGTTTLKIKIKKKSGTKTYKMKLKVVKYKNPVAKFKLSGKNYAKKFKKSIYADVQRPNAKDKVAVKAAKGWKIKKIVHFYVSGDKYIEKKIKNGSKVKWKTDFDSIMVTLVNKKKGLTENITLSNMNPDLL